MSSLTIWKFVLDKSVNDILVPADAMVIHAHESEDQTCVWLMVDPSARRVIRRFLVVDTGERLSPEIAKSVYVGTAHRAKGNWVVHVYDRGEIS